MVATQAHAALPTSASASRLGGGGAPLLAQRGDHRKIAFFGQKREHQSRGVRILGRPYNGLINQSRSYAEAGTPNTPNVLKHGGGYVLAGV